VFLFVIKSKGRSGVHPEAGAFIICIDDRIDWMVGRHAPEADDRNSLFIRRCSLPQVYPYAALHLLSLFMGRFAKAGVQ
jgi:hypothetical protein